MVAEKKTKKSAAKATTKKEGAPSTSVASQASVESSDLGVRRFAIGVVSSNKMTKTIVVKVDRQVRHGLYRKYLTKSQKVKAHDEKNSAQVGDLVELVESRPLSRGKRWVLRKIVRKAAQTLDANV